MKSLAVLVASCALSAVAVADSSDWPGLRGPRHDGGAPGTLDATEGAGFAVAWRAALGAGLLFGRRGRGPRRHPLLRRHQRRGGGLRRAHRARAVAHRDRADAPRPGRLLRRPDRDADAQRRAGLRPRAAWPPVRRSTPPPAASCGRWTSSTRERAKLPLYGFGASPIVAGGVLVVQLGAAERRRDGRLRPRHRGPALAPRRRRRRVPVAGRAVAWAAREQVVAVSDTQICRHGPRGAGDCCSSTRTAASCTRWRPRASCRFRPATAACS